MRKQFVNVIGCLSTLAVLWVLPNSDYCQSANDQSSKSRDCIRNWKGKSESVHLSSNRISRLIENRLPLKLVGLSEGRLSGVLRVQIFVDKEGKIQCLKVRGGHPLVRGSAAVQISKWEFTPYIFKNKNYSYYGILLVRYDIRADRNS